MGEWGEVPGLRVKIISLNSLCTVLICTVWRSKPAEALFEWHYIWEYPTAARILGGYSSWGKKKHRGLKLLCQNSACVPHSLRLGQRTSFTGGAGNILGMYRTRLGMNSFQRASPLSFTSINNKSAWSNGVSRVQIAQKSCEWHLHSPHSGATLGNTKTSAEE